MIRRGELTQAIAACDRELVAAPRSAPHYALKGLALSGMGAKPAALATLRQALAIQPAYAPALLAAAQIEFESRDPHASKSLESVLRLDPGSATAHAMLATLRFEERKCAQALAHFEKAALESPSYKWQYGVCLMELRRWTDAAKQFAALLRLREHAPTRYNLALAYWSAKDDRSTIATLTAVPNSDADAMRLLAGAYEGAGNLPQALATLQGAAAQSPRDESLLIDLAVFCLDHQAIDLGIDVVRGGLQSMGPSAKLNTLLGVLLVRRGEVEAGEDAFRQAQALDPSSGLGPIGLASMLMQMGRAADAERVLREQLTAKGADPRTEFTLVRALLLKGATPAELREAAGILRRSLRKDPGQAGARGLLGKVYAQLGQLPQAATELAEALRLDPADRASAYQLMTVYRRTGRQAEAAALTRRVASLLEEEKAAENTAGRFRLVR